MLIVLVVVQLPDLTPYVANLLIHQPFFLGPANDVIHGRAMMPGTAWSQYGVGLIDVLSAGLQRDPDRLRNPDAAHRRPHRRPVRLRLRHPAAVGLGFVLTLAALAVAAIGNLFATLEAYVVFPSTSPLRFGIPYLIVLCAVIGAHFPQWRRASRIGVLALLAIAATWSFESFAYSAGAYGLLVLAEAIAAGEGAGGRVVRGGLLGIGVSAAAVTVLSLATLILSGHLDWGPYFEYVSLYSTHEFFNLPIDFFSAGPLMGATLFASAAMVLWLVRALPDALSPAMRAALAGFTGFAIVSFTYYLGRSHPNNLLALLVPVIAIAALWMQLLLASPTVWWRTGAGAVIAVAMAMIAVAGWPSVESKAGNTALGLAFPGGRSLGDAAGRSPVTRR